ncbi:hypothetical protein HPB50_014026 [Hyalomma asiaticum]|uniref:Uncharacterized protein n=1 Tax=Hyalomma asiaticum TaxID=266040 RepID=A0ACB7TA27_HYAAI|nr:hypothetical protein HPB50_014026 [Hyalomma asiaticum]
MDELMDSVAGPASYGSRLNDEATLSFFFLSLVEQFPALWDPSRDDYANNILRNALRTFFNNKRRTYRNERKKVNKTKSGQPADDAYAGKWKFFTALSFLETTRGHLFDVRSPSLSVKLMR